MKTIADTMAGYRVYDYRLVLSPHDELRNKISQVRKEFFEAYKGETGLKSFGAGRPHLALVNFTQYGMNEERIFSRLKTIAMGYHPFKVEMKDFGSFPTHTIYINVSSRLPIQNLVKMIRTESQRLMKFDEDHKPHFLMEPFITVARKLLPWQYEKGWLDYSNKHFAGKFIADAMLLLKREVGEMKFQVVQRFEFQNLPVITRQGELFG
jgi:2'-5' RNA ligase